MAAGAPTSLLLDLQATQSKAHGLRGIARYATHLALALLDHPGRVRCLLLNPELPPPAGLAPRIANSPLLAWNTARTQRDAMRERHAAFWSLSPFEFPAASLESTVGAHVVARGGPLFATLYDLIPLGLPGLYLSDPAVRQRYQARLELFRHCRLVFCISAHTRRVAIERLGLAPDAAVDIGSGVDARFSPRPPGESAAREPFRRLHIDRPYLLTMLGEDPRKNLDGFLSACGRLPADLRRDHLIVVAGAYRPPAIAAHRDQATRAGLAADRLLFTGTLTDAELVALYRGARLFVFPSLAEGFGLPIAEAAATGCPCLTSNTTACPEVLDCPEGTFDPHDPDAMSHAMQRALTDGALRERLIRSGLARTRELTWQRVAQRALAAIDALPAPSKARPPHPPRIALIGPLPGDETGVADYNARIAGELARHAQVDVFVPDAARHQRLPGRGFRVLPQGDLGSALAPHGYDALLYSFGNSRHYVGGLELLRRFPGIAWCHDVRLYALFLSEILLHTPGPGQTEAVRRLLRDLYGDTPRSALPAEPFDVEHYQSAGIGFMPGIVRHAQALLLHSQHALETVRADLPPGLALPPVTLIPLAVPAARTPIVREAAAAPLIASFGILHPMKAPEALIDAVARLNRTRAVDLALVGPVDPAYAADLRRQAGAAGIAARVTITGRTPAADYDGWLERTDIAVQLRAASHGESSAAISDALAHGLPVLTNAPAYAEVPPGVADYIEGAATAALLAERLARLLDDPSGRQRRRAAALRYAAQHSFARIAERVLETALAHPPAGPALPVG